ncbi:hypothetical protein ABFV99_25675 [Cytobacillus horneckiae]|uniref:hypothetical protein n=1 Tax=Cytobacillus horneckiae TaxID=549687 RepID=UPI0034CDF3C0
MDFPWYEEITEENSIHISQGDIINCKVPFIIETKQAPYFNALQADIKGIVMTQACDLENDRVKVNEFTICPIVTLEEVLKDKMIKQFGNDPGFKYDSMTAKQRQQKYNYAEKIRQGNILDYYLLNNYESDTTPVLNQSFQVVTLRFVYRVPIGSLKNQVRDNPIKRLRLLPPYREHLSHAFSFNFSRIGLPTDILIPKDI